MAGDRDPIKEAGVNNKVQTKEAGDSKAQIREAGVNKDLTKEDGDNRDLTKADGAEIRAGDDGICLVNNHLLFLKEILSFFI